MTIAKLSKDYPSIGSLNVGPRALDDYRLLAKLARGGMATVYVARKNGPAGFERLVAIKCCHSHLVEDDDFVAMFLDEARLAGRIHHPNVVSTIDVGHEGHLYLVMDYVEGDTLSGVLSQAVQRGDGMPPGVALRVAIDVLRGLHAAHEVRAADGTPLQIVHRDVSPQNILVGSDGVSRITDFGIAHAASRSASTRTGAIKGKFAYVAPEQVSAEKVTRRIDIFSCGTVLWEALTCRRLFRRDDDAGTLGAVLKASIPPPSSLSEVEEGVDEIIFKAMRRDPQERYETAAEFADALERLPGVASTQEVSCYVVELLKERLERRRELIQIATEQPTADWALETDDSRTAHPAEDELRTRVTRSGQHVLKPVVDETLPPDIHERDTVRPPPPAASLPESQSGVEPSRGRFLLAAIMLLLVGSALGLLLSSNNSKEQDNVASPADKETGASTR